MVYIFDNTSRIAKHLTVYSATGSPIDSLFLSDVIDVIIDYGKPLGGNFKLDVVSCFLVSSTHSFALIKDGLVNQVSDQPVDWLYQTGSELLQSFTMA